MSSFWPDSQDLAHLDDDVKADPVLVDLRDLWARIDEDPNDRSLSLALGDDDGHTVVAELVVGIGGLGGAGERQAIAGLERLAERAMQLSALLRVRAGDRKVLEALADAAPEPGLLAGPPVNVSGDVSFGA